MERQKVKTAVVVLAVTVLVGSLTMFAFAQAPQAGQTPAAAPAAGQAAPAGGAQGGGRAGGGGGGGGRGGGGQAAPARPAPRWPDGTIRLGPIPGETGLWFGEFGGGGPAIPAATFQPWAQAVFDYRRLNELEPHARCKPSGVVRQFQTPYGVDIVDIPETKRIYLFDVGGPHTVRIIYMDGRQHPKDLVPSYYGHSIGRWEGDVLVVDTIGFNEKFWLDRAGSPHTEKMRVTERFTRTDMNRMRYEYTVDDPTVYTAPWTKAANIDFRVGQELFEYICQDNNLGSELMVGTQEAVDRSSQIIP